MNLKFKLEHIAREWLNHFVARQNAGPLHWKYLSTKRKLDWMIEVQTNLFHCLDFVRDQLIVPKATYRGSASYEKGFIAGKETENERLRLQIEALKEYLEQELETFRVQNDIEKI